MNDLFMTMNCTRIQVASRAFLLIWGQVEGRTLLDRLVLPWNHEAMKQFPMIKDQNLPGELQPVKDFLVRYFAGNFSLPPVDLLNRHTMSGFRKKVSDILLKIPPGKVISYDNLASRAGYPGASRAVGSTMSSNPFPLLYPRHRVVRSNGQVGYFQSGIQAKQFLLEHEGVIIHNNTVTAENMIRETGLL